MYYEPGEGAGHKAAGLPHSPFTAIVGPRPIGWISTQDREGRVNLAPFSYFNGVCSAPPMVIFASNGNHGREGQPGPAIKDTLANVRETGEFVVNLATWELREQMNLSSAPAPRGVDEFEFAGLAKAASNAVKPPRVAASPVHLECKLVQVVELPAHEASNTLNNLVIGRVVGIHVRDDLIDNGRVSIAKVRPLLRLGAFDYGFIESVFEIKRPKWPLDGKAS
ncbi:MAG: flavin reductase [Betaproteobacteria bacterium]|nr:flavin reductase [Betaproteobacteria bacterium]